MSDDEWVALIGGIALVVAGLLSVVGLLIKSILDGGVLRDKVDALAKSGMVLAGEVDVIKQQVKNSHTDSNLREDVDGIRDEIRGLRSDMGNVRSDTREDIRDLRREVTRAIEEHPKLWAAIQLLRHPLGGGSDKET